MFSQFRRHRTSEDVGHVVTFSLKKPCTGLVCQYVVHKVRFEGQRRAKVRKFTEACTVRDGKVTPAGGRDCFLLPTTFSTRAGCCSIRAFAWFLPCDRMKVLTELGMLDAKLPISGVINPGEMPAKYRRTRGIQRTWDAQWDASSGPFRPKITHSIALKYLGCSSQTKNQHSENQWHPFYSAHSPPRSFLF
jgi:hypothetical protein